MIKFKDLSWPLKTVVVFGYIAMALWIISFMIGIFIGLTGGY